MQLWAGHVYALEHLPQYAQLTREWAVRHGVQNITVIDAPLQTHVIGGEQWDWYDISNVPAIAYDFLVVDGPPRKTGALARYPMLPLFAKQLGPSPCLLLDDADRADEEAIVRRWQAEFPQFRTQRHQTQKGAVLMTAGSAS
ncbi:hypothetical protein [Mesorhizobium huakuii]